jgi:hypothetical protein
MHSCATPGPITSDSRRCRSRPCRAPPRSPAHRRRPRLGAEDADDSERRARVDALPLHLLGDRQHVRRRHHDDVGLEVENQLHLLLRLAADIGITVQPSFSAP